MSGVIMSDRVRLTDEEFEQLVGTASDGSLEDLVRCTAIRTLAETKDKRLYLLFLNLICEGSEHTKLDSILAMGISKDSRVLFPLMNFYNYATTEERNRILMAMQNLGDPRALPFLYAVFSETKDESLANVALEAYTNINASLDQRFFYRFVGEESVRSDAKRGVELTVHVKSLEDLENSREKIFNDFNNDRPQTYVVLPNGALYVGGLIHEHVEVAMGNDVLAAGEIEFNNNFGVNYFNNRSNGYYPSSNSLRFLQESLDEARIPRADGFRSEIFPKDGYNDKEFLRMFALFKD